MTASRSCTERMSATSNAPYILPSGREYTSFAATLCLSTISPASISKESMNHSIAQMASESSLMK